MKFKKSQQLVEFLLVVPFVVIILGILTEYAYALNINLTLTQGLKTVSTSVYSDIRPGMTAGTIRSTMLTNLQDYLSANNVPTNAENSIRLNYVQLGETTIFMASYVYIPAFTLPNVYFKILPDQFNFLATTSIPTAFLRYNNYDTAITSTVLDGIWSASNFASIDQFNGSKRGVLRDTTGRSRMLFLIYNDSNSDAVTLASGTATVLYTLVNWDGTLLSDGTNTYNVNMSNGRLYACAPPPAAASCSLVSPAMTLMNYVINNNLYNIIIIDTADDDFGMLSGDLSNLSTYWIVPAASTDLSPTTVTGMLKRAVSLYDSTGTSIGNYDSPITPDSSLNTYTVTTFGSAVFTHPSGLSVTNIETGTAPNRNNAYNFEY